MSELVTYQSGTCAAGSAIMAIFYSSSLTGATCAPTSCQGSGSIGVSTACNGSASHAISQISGSAIVASYYSDAACSSASSVQTVAIVLDKCISFGASGTVTMAFKYTYDAAKGFDVGVYTDAACTVKSTSTFTTSTSGGIPQCEGISMPSAGQCLKIPDSCVDVMKQSFQSQSTIGSFMFSISGSGGNSGSGNSAPSTTAGSSSAGTGTGTGGAAVTTTKSGSSPLTVASGLLLAMLFV
ncbi:hypothetical protein BCR33DRAFT_850021 [Rhizoclosmatium globosum]|uniref:Uncharacterized protein n=1 Tax=Rhizoclosmatium globosum TaxID=329046 RepID=A0A1Y2CFP8_9FUNG|nr:hypothetical protein BCR33DRAFT_850021 [Rhizoclosmatium globosum]|eukprot:ORY45125.1 hypothetical protein BCR33DRAFT_850021 [Rhizoclosmatium globosum]